MNNNIQCSIESSTTKIELNSAVDGVFLVPELEGLVGLPEIRTTSGVNAGYDGGWTSAQNYDARLISIRGVIANPDISKVEDKRRAIASLLGQGRKEQLTLRFTTEAGNAYAISVRTISCEMALQRVLTTQEFLIQLRADDPLIYDDGAAGGIAAILQPQRALGGFEINFGLPLAIGGGAEDTVVDNGNETVYPVIKLYGALHSPTVVNRTTNQQMQILADLQYSIDWHTYHSATGDYILVNDGLNGAPMTLSQLLGNAEQTTYSGKNLARPNGNNTAAGVSFVWNSDGTITLNGTSTAAIDVWVANGGSGATEFTIPTGTKLTQSFRVVSGSASANTWAIRTNLYYGGASHWSDAIGNTTFTATSETQVRGLEVLAPSSGLTFNNLRLEIQLEKSATATAWEPYVGGTPAPNPQFPMPISTVTGEQNIKVVGKNLVEDALVGANIDSLGRIVATDGFQMNLAPVMEGKTYTMSIDGNQHNQYVYAFFTSKPVFNSTSYDGTRIVVLNNPTFTAPITGYVAFRTSDGYANAQLELGSTATAYEPYHGQSYEVNLGKNLLDINSLATGGVTVSNGVATGQGLHFYAAYGQNTDGIPFIKMNGQLAISFKAYTDGNVSTANTNGLVVRVVYTDGASALVIYCKNNETAAVQHTAITTFGKDVANIQLTYANDGGNIWHISEFQIEKGGQATTYAPYFTPIELAKIGTYQDRIYKDDGKWYIEKNVGKLNMADIMWDGLNGAGNPYHIGFVTHYGAEKTATISNILTYSATAWAGNGKFGIASSGSLWMMTGDSTVDASNAPSWLANKNAIMYYALATPTTTEITDETLLAQLNFLASLYEGVNNISLVGTGAQGEMAISYATDYTVNQDVITIDSQARTITLNGQDIYHLKTSESEFLVLAPGENKLYLTSEVSDDSGYAEVKFKQGYLSI